MGFVVSTLYSADDTRLSKTYELVNGSIESSAYPLVRDFTSVNLNVSDISEMKTVIDAVAEAGGCLLKGVLKQPLIAQSRQGTTNPVEATKYLVLDLDFEDGWNSIDEFLYAVHPSLIDVSYVFQHSASAGIKCQPGLRGHVFFELSTEANPPMLKEWLKFVNLNVPGLRERTSLSDSGGSLKWPLDITTCQNDKLIFVAPPTCIGFDPPDLDPRVVYVERRTQYVASSAITNVAPSLIQSLTDKRVAELRKDLGLPAKSIKYKRVGNVTYHANPDTCVITGVREARGFVYLNLNGGDSWSRYFPADNPEFLYNFRGEPVVKLRDVAPEFYADYVQNMPGAGQPVQNTTAMSGGQTFRPLVFRDRRRDVYYNAIYYPESGQIDFSPASTKSKLSDFMAQYGHDMPDVIHDWTVEFDPTRLDIIDIDHQWINTFHPTPLLREATPAEAVSPPPIIDRIIRSVCGGCEYTQQYFYNWLAYIVQTRKKTGTAWVFHGIEGTGKGLMLSRVLKPILGYDYVVEQTATALDDSFNAQLEKAIVLFIDEFRHDDTRSSVAVMNKLKNLITEDYIMLRMMRQNPVQVVNYCNVIIASNHQDSVTISDNDRRFNIAPPQETKLEIDAAEIDAIEEELPYFTDFLMGYRVNEANVRTTMKNDARMSMILASMTSVDSFFAAFRTGDLEFFLGFAKSGGVLQDGIAFSEYNKIMQKFARDCAEGQPSMIDIGELRMLYAFIIGKSGGLGPAKIKRMLSLHRVPVNTYNNTVPVEWKKTNKKLATRFLTEHETGELKAVQ